MALFLLNPIGTAGDVHPHMAIGTHLKAMGHSVRILATPNYRSLAESCGLEFHSIGENLTAEEVAKDPRLKRPYSAWKAAMEWAATGLMREVYQTIERIHLPNETVVVAPLWNLGARVARDKLGIHLSNVILNPCLLRSCNAPPRLPMLPMFRWTPSTFKRFQYYLADRLVLDPILTPKLNSFRAELGLRAVRRVMDRWWFSPDQIIGLFSDVFAPPQMDWPVPVEIVGHTLWDPPALPNVMDEVEEFLGTSKQAIVVIPGSAGPGSDSFLKNLYEACREIDRPLLLLSPLEYTNLPQNSQHFHHCRYAPLAKVLPKCSLAIHSACIGTLFQSLAAAIPQIAFPQVNDQFDNAQRLCKLGVGTIGSLRRASVKQLVSLIHTTLSSKRIRFACDSHQAMHQNGSAKEAAHLMVSLAPTTPNIASKKWIQNASGVV